MDRIILHCDMNNFFASVECALEPSLKNKPVAVCGNTEQRHGIVLAKNGLAKAAGICTGEVIWQAKLKCANLVTVLPHYDKYMEYSRRARQIYSDYTDMIEPFGADECWLDVTGSTLLFGNGYSIADTIRQRIKKELGVTVSCGVSYNKIFAKLGSDMKKPDAVTEITRGNYKDKVWRLPASDLFGVGRSTQRILELHGIYTIGDLANCNTDYLAYHLKSSAYVLKAYANGADASPVLHKDYVYEAQSIGHGTTAAQDLYNNAEVWRVMLGLVQEIADKLLETSCRAKGIMITVRDCDLFIKQWQCALPVASRYAGTLAKAAWELFCKNYNWEKSVRSVTVTAIKLYRDDVPEQLDMLQTVQQREKTERLQAAVYAIRKRFGQQAIRTATLCCSSKADCDKLLTPMPKPRFTI